MTNEYLCSKCGQISKLEDLGWIPTDKGQTASCSCGSIKFQVLE